MNNVTCLANRTRFLCSSIFRIQTVRRTSVTTYRSALVALRDQTTKNNGNHPKSCGSYGSCPRRRCEWASADSFRLQMESGGRCDGTSRANAARRCRSPLDLRLAHASACSHHTGCVVQMEGAGSAGHRAGRCGWINPAGPRSLINHATIMRPKISNLWRTLCVLRFPL